MSRPFYRFIAVLNLNFNVCLLSSPPPPFRGSVLRKHFISPVRAILGGKRSSFIVQNLSSHKKMLPLLQSYTSRPPNRCLDATLVTANPADERLNDGFDIGSNFDHRESGLASFSSDL